MGSTVNRVGINYADNIIDPLLAFNTSQTWSVSSGTGSASLDTNILFEGVSCLKMINTDPTNDLVITNSTQTTTIPFDGNYMLSLYMRKVEARESMTLEVKTFQNASPFNTQTFVLNEDAYGNDIDDVFQRFVADVPFNFSKGDDITFTFNLKGKAGTALLNTTIWIDGIQLEPIETNNKMPSTYKSPKGEKKQLFGIYDYNDLATSTTPISVSATTWTHLTNDGAGAYTNKTYALDSVADVFDTTSGLFDFSDLELGDEVTIRFNANITTNSANQTLKLRLKAAIGTGSEYTISFVCSPEFKTAAEHELPSFGTITMLNTDTLNNGARFEIYTSDTADVEVVGWQCKVNKRLV